MKKQNEKKFRLKYIRGLEKFRTRTITALKHPLFNIEVFKHNIEKFYEELKQIEPIRLDSEYHKRLQSFINLVLQKSSNHSKTFNEEIELLLKESNLLEKEKNKTNYKKSKHKKRDFTDGY